MRAERHQVVERRHARAELALERVEHERHRHRARAVRNEDEHARAVERAAAPARRARRGATSSAGRYPVHDALADNAHAAIMSRSARPRIPVGGRGTLPMIAAGRAGHLDLRYDSGNGSRPQCEVDLRGLCVCPGGRNDLSDRRWCSPRDTCAQPFSSARLETAAAAARSVFRGHGSR